MSYVLTAGRCIGNILELELPRFDDITVLLHGKEFSILHVEHHYRYNIHNKAFTSHYDIGLIQVRLF